MIEIITEKVDMPKGKRKYDYKPVDSSGRKWIVIDTESNDAVVYRGKYEMAAIACHNLNKKHYKQKQ